MLYENPIKYIFNTFIEVYTEWLLYAFLMAILKYLVLLFIVSCAHLPAKQNNMSFNDNGHHHNIGEYNHLLQQYKYNSSIVNEKEPEIPEIVPLPIEFPDLTTSNQVISINVSEEVSVKTPTMD